MSLLDAHEEDFRAAATALPYIPPPRPPSKFSAWSAAPRGIAAGAAESAGFWSDVVGAFGQVGGAYPEALGVDPTPQQRKQADEARRKLLTSGLDFSSEAGDLFRGVAAGYKADPGTTSAAEQVIFGFSRFGAKAIGYSAAAGPVVGSLLTGADEGMTAADDLRQRGVDEATRTKVGAITGVASALAVALPVVGRTALETTGLVLAGGPGSFMAQQEATRYVLANADYHALAEQYDPFDPVGLAVSTLVPAGFGAWGLRGARAAKVSAEHVDAARVALLSEQRQGADVSPGDLAGMQAHENALSKAEQQLAAGERVTADVPVGEQGARALGDLQSRIAEALDSPAFVRAKAGIPGGDRFTTDRFMAEINGTAKPFDPQADIEGRAKAAAGREPPPASEVDSITALRSGMDAPAMSDSSKQAPNPDADQAAARRAQRLAVMQETLPDLMVRSDDMEQAMPLKDFLAKVKAEADELTADAPLFKMAAECALLNP